jgi:7-cyano-7-deazaguanine synthase
MTRKVVVLFSGGLDSTVCLVDAIDGVGAENVTALTMFYGQKHVKELECAKDITNFLGVAHLIRDLSAVFTMDSNPLLSSSSEAIPQGSYDEQARDADGMSKTYVPFRNGLFLAYATAIAYSIGASLVVYGAHADDAAGNAYPDCTPAFYDGMNTAITEGTGKKVQLYAPLIDMNKARVVTRGVELRAPLHLSWSCYEGREKACGKCGTCIDRKAAFAANGMVDTIPYED